MEPCLFCRIIAGELTSDVVYEDTEFFAFRDIAPRAPVHLLVIPRQHLATLADYPDDERGALAIGRLVATTNRLARSMALAGWQLKVHVGPAGGQEVFHVHIHLLGGW